VRPRPVPYDGAVYFFLGICNIYFDFFIAVESPLEVAVAISSYGILHCWRQSSPLIDLLADEIVGDLVALVVEVLVVAVGAGGVEGLLVYHTVFPQDFLRRVDIVDWQLMGALCLVQTGG